MTELIDLSVEQITKYNLRVPRYTSYPTVPNWSKEDFGPQDYSSALKEISGSSDPLSLYIHIPFCIRRCLYCACNVSVTRDIEKPIRYMIYLFKEIEEAAKNLGERNEVVQLHLGGGTPTHLTPEQMTDLFTKVNEEFNVLKEAELSIEIHPSVTSEEQLDVLADFGFKRLSVGVQDFSPEVQKKLNRHQTYEETASLIDYSRENVFESINIDLIYGLPYQTMEGIKSTIEKVLIIRPERIALYSYAHFPTKFSHQATIPEKEVPKGAEKLLLFLEARKKLLENGYEQIGFDHFSLKEDELSKSYRDKTLRRNFMGYSTRAGTDMLAFGWSGISELSTGYAQNSKEMGEYEQLVDKFGTATIKGHTMSFDDKIRKQVIMDILCLGELDIPKLQKQFNHELDFIVEKANQVFPEFEEIDFLEKKVNGWKLRPKGNVFGRVIASTFDEYYDQKYLFSQSV
ncbi:MAG: oxygen-independent coproporphyrinogen III oxidase [Candidatus Kariarchaeaceae archaeon]